jgi:K+-transporting ATPase ATPase C chain
MLRIVRPLLLSGLLLLLFGVLFPGLVWALAQLVPGRAAGSPVVAQGRVVGFRYIGQQFRQPGYFHGRPSVVGYNAASTGASNLSASSPALLAAARAHLDTFLLENPDVRPAQVPIELLTASGSGLDPDLSPAAALVQVPRVASARRLPPAQVAALVQRQTTGPWLGFMGPAHVNVLALNVVLDSLTGRP